MTFDEYGYPDDDTIIKIKTFDLGLKFEKSNSIRIPSFNLGQLGIFQYIVPK